MTCTSKNDCIGYEPNATDCQTNNGCAKRLYDAFDNEPEIYEDDPIEEEDEE